MTLDLTAWAREKSLIVEEKQDPRSERGIVLQVRPARPDEQPRYVPLSRKT